MATARIVIKNGKIVDYADRYFDGLSADGKTYTGNGWVVTLEDGRQGRPGRVICHAERNYADGPAVCHREFKLADGMVGLAGGNIYSRYAYFRSEEFSSWLEDHALQCVIREDPNQVFYSHNPAGSYWSHDLQIETDGIVHYVDDSFSKYRVVGATYAVVRQRYCDGVHWHLDQGVLYTLVKDVTKIGGIFSRKEKAKMPPDEVERLERGGFIPR